MACFAVLLLLPARHAENSPSPSVILEIRLFMPVRLRFCLVLTMLSQFRAFIPHLRLVKPPGRLLSSSTPDAPRSSPLSAVEEEVDPGAVEGTDKTIVKYPHPALRKENELCTDEEVRWSLLGGAKAREGRGRTEFFGVLGRENFERKLVLLTVCTRWHEATFLTPPFS